MLARWTGERRIFRSSVAPKHRSHLPLFPRRMENHGKSRSHVLLFPSVSHLARTPPAAARKMDCPLSTPTAATHRGCALCDDLGAPRTVRSRHTNALQSRRSKPHSSPFRTASLHPLRSIHPHLWHDGATLGQAHPHPCLSPRTFAHVELRSLGGIPHFAGARHTYAHLGTSVCVGQPSTRRTAWFSAGYDSSLALRSRLVV